jgi:hypothetical protein
MSFSGWTAILRLERCGQRTLTAPIKGAVTDFSRCRNRDVFAQWGFAQRNGTEHKKHKKYENPFCAFCVRFVPLVFRSFPVGQSRSVEVNSGRLPILIQEFHSARTAGVSAAEQNELRCVCAILKQAWNKQLFTRYGKVVAQSQHRSHPEITAFVFPSSEDGDGNWSGGGSKLQNALKGSRKHLEARELVSEPAN